MPAYAGMTDLQFPQCCRISPIPKEPFKNICSCYPALAWLSMNWLS